MTPIRLISFGYLHQPTGPDGAPIPPAADRVEDVRERLRDPAAARYILDLDGRDRRVQKAVLDTPGARELLINLGDAAQLPAGPRTIAIGCAGGKHRAAALVELLARLLYDRGHRDIEVEHRHIDLPRVREEPASAGRLRLTPLSAAELDRTANAVQDRYPGYPAPHERLYLDSPGLRLNGGRVTVPAGPWHVHDHPNRHTARACDLDAEVPGAGGDSTHPALQARWIAQGLSLDQHGRPLHPYWRQLLADPRIGLPTGAGYFWRYGPNPTVDAAIYRRRGDRPVELLLIRRRNGGRWALPGGYRDRTDTSGEQTARREAAEETGLNAIGGHAETLAHTRSIGPMATLHAWTENQVVLIHGDPTYLAETTPIPGDDAVDARWATLETIAGLNLYDLHRQHIATALEHINHTDHR